MVAGYQGTITSTFRHLIMEFLTYLFLDKQLAPGMVAGYQAAITSTFRHLGHLDVGHKAAMPRLPSSLKRAPADPGFSSVGPLPGPHGLH